jgi:hypothetical protein
MGEPITSLRTFSSFSSLTPVLSLHTLHDNHCALHSMSGCTRRPSPHHLSSQALFTSLKTNTSLQPRACFLARTAVTCGTRQTGTSIGGGRGLALCGERLTLTRQGSTSSTTAGVLERTSSRLSTVASSRARCRLSTVASSCALPFVSKPLVNSDENVNNHARLLTRITRVCMVHPVQAMHAGVARASSPVATTC